MLISTLQIMKSIISLIIVSLLNFSFSQSEITVIDYQIEIIDSLTGLKYHNPFIKMNPQFTVKYDSNTVKIWRKHSEGSFEQRIIDKNKNEVLYLASDAGQKHVSYVSTSDILNIDMSHNYGDTVIKTTNEHKNILGYDCYKIEMNLGNQASAILWVTNEIKTGIIIPETPMSLEYIALEYVFSDPSLIYEFKAKSVKKITENISDTSIPDDYSLTTPVSEFDVSDDLIEVSNDFEFVHYPKYEKGKGQLHQNIRDLCSLFPKDEEDPLNFNVAFIKFNVNKDGSVTNILVEGINNKKEKENIIQFLTESLFIPGEIKSEKVNASVTLMVSLDE